MDNYTIEEYEAAFTEWDRRWREEPDRFLSESAHLAESTEEYGQGAALYFVQILEELRAALS